MKTLILLLALSFLHCQAVPVKRQTIDDEDSQKLEALGDNFRMIRTVAQNTFCHESESRRECLEFFSPARVSRGECNEMFYLEPEALCYVYERYIDHAYSVLTTPLDSPLYATYTANQYVTWKSLNSTCSWVRQVTGDSIIPSCTLPEIKQVCNQFRLYGHVTELSCHLNRRVNAINEDRETEGRLAVRSGSVENWLEDNLAPESIGSALLRTTGCSLDSNQEYQC